MFITSVDDKVLGEKLVLPEHVLQFIPVKSKREAYYICAVLNSSLVIKQLYALSSHGKSGLSASIVKQIRLDKFDPKNSTHDSLATLSMQAHGFSNLNDAEALEKVEKTINETVELLYKKPKEKYQASALLGTPFVG